MPQPPDELHGIVQRMIDAGEPEENIATVIQHYGSQPKGDTYKGPDTFGGGFMQSVKDTASRTGSSILSGFGAVFNPMTYERGNEAKAANEQENAQAVTEALKTGKFPPTNPATSIGSIRGQLISAGQNLSTPEGGGEAIGGLIAGAVVPRAIGATGPVMKRGSLRMMNSALKVRDSLVNARRGAGFASKDAVSQAVLDEGRLVSPGGLEKAQDALDATDAAAHARLRAGAGAGVTVDPFRVTSAIDAQATGRFGKQINAQPDTSAIQAVHENFATNPHISDPVTGMAPIDAVTAHEFATNTGSNLKGKFGRLGGATVEAEKAGREAIVSQLRDQIPELQTLWDDEARQITARDAIGQAVARRSNTDPIGLGPLIGMVKNPGMAAVAMADRSAIFKSLLAHGLNKGQALAQPSAAAIRAALIARLFGGSKPAEQP